MNSMKKKVLSFILAVMIFAALLPGMAYAENQQPFTLEAPGNLIAELKYDGDGVPFFELKLDVPKSVQEVNQNLLEDSQFYDGVDCYEIEIQFDFKYGDYDWNAGESFQWNTSIYLEEFLDKGNYCYYPFGESDKNGEINIEAEVYQFRAYFFSDWGYVDGWVDNQVKSDFSNIVVIGNPAYYKGASAWAKAELDKALDYGFITDRVRDNMSANITREEFAEVAVKMYEKYKGKAAAYTDMSAFTDTQNPEIFKAYDLKIVNGVGGNKFAPKDPITREQMAAMLYRLVQAIAPDTDFSTTGTLTFADEKNISNWALENVRFMSKHGYINGVGENRFGPKLSSTREQSVAVAVRLYEKYTGIKE